MTSTSPVVLGLAGGTASGKTTAARALLDRLGDQALLLTHDRYYRSLPDGHDPAGWNFDHPDALETELLAAHLDELLAGREVAVPRYAFDHHRRAHRSEWTTVRPRPVVVVEGILVLADEGLRTRMHQRVFVHAPRDVRLVRRIRRDVAERGREVSQVLEQYMRTVRPMHERWVEPSRAHAHHVLDGTRPVDELVAELTGLLDVG